MTEERLKEIKDSIDFQKKIYEIKGYELGIVQEEIDLYNEVMNLKEENERLKKKHNFVETALLEEETDLNLVEIIENIKEENERLKKELNKHIKEGIEKDTEIKEQNDDIEWWTNRFNAVERDKREYKTRIDKANVLLQEILVVEDWEHKGRYRPVKNTSSQDVYKTICKLTELLETPHRINYGLLQGSDKE